MLRTPTPRSLEGSLVVQLLGPPAVAAGVCPVRTAQEGLENRNEAKGT